MSRIEANEETYGIIKEIKWYNNPHFSLIPQVIKRKSNKYNTSGFTFNWMVFRIWSLDSFGFELSIVADTHWGIGIIGILPYLRWTVCIPLPIKLGLWFDRKTNRYKITE